MGEFCDETAKRCRPYALMGGLLRSGVTRS
jgi:hypothetical protein